MRLLTQVFAVLTLAGLAPILTAATTLPAGAQYRVTVTAARPEYILGENVIITFTLENIGSVEFTASFGGDYRGGTRANRFKVTATNAGGRNADDPSPDQLNFGGFGQEVKLEPGRTHVEKISLSRYCRITQPGTQVIRVSHDCGWPAGAGPAPAGETTVTFLLPSAAEAETIVGQIVTSSAKTKLPDGWLSGTDLMGLHEWSDLASLQSPAYLPALLKLADAGDPQAVPGIAGIVTPEATSGLIRLAREGAGKVAVAAAVALRNRLPDLTFPNQPPRVTPQARLATLAWDEKLRPAALDLARAWLPRPEQDRVIAAAGILRYLGGNEDAPRLFLALGAAIKPLTAPQKEYSGNYPQPVRALLDAMVGLRLRGYVFPAPGGDGDGARFAYLDKFRATQGPRPAGWMDVLTAGCASPSVALREAAIRSVPSPVPPECLALVEAAKADPDGGVQAAVLVVTQRKVRIARPPGFPPGIPDQFIDVPPDGPSLIDPTK